MLLVMCAKNSKTASSLREWSFLILGTGADDFLQGYETILLFILKNFYVAVKVAVKVNDIHFLNEALGAYLHNIQYPKHARRKANRITESFLLHNSTVIALSCIWYCIGLIFCELLIRLPVMRLELGFAKMKYMQH